MRNEIGVLRRFCEDNVKWAEVPRSECDFDQAESIFIQATIDHQFFLEPFDWSQFLEDEGLTLGSDEMRVRIIGGDIRTWIGVLNAIIRSERFNSGTIRENIENGVLQLIIAQLLVGDYDKIFPEENDFVFDSNVEAKERRKGRNPKRTSVVDAINERRLALGVLPYLPKEDSPQCHKDALSIHYLLTAHQYCGLRPKR